MQIGVYPAKENTSNVTSVFYGLNRCRRAAQGEMEDMSNMSPFEYPCAAPRGARVKAADAPAAVHAAAAPDITNTEEVAGFTGVAGNGFYYNGTLKSVRHRLGADCDWSIERFGNLYILNGYRGTESFMYTYNIDTDTFAEAGKVMDDLIVTAGVDGTGSYLAAIPYGYSRVMDYTVTDNDGNVINNYEFFRKYCPNYSSSYPTFDSENIFEKYFSVGEEVSIAGFPGQANNVGQVWSHSTGDGYVTPQTSLGYEDNNTTDADAYADNGELSRFQIVDARVKSFRSVSRSVQQHSTYIHYIYFDLYNKNGDSIEFDEMGGATEYYCSGVKLSSRRRVFTNIAAHQGRVWGTSPTGNMLIASSSDDIFSFSAADIEAKYGARLPSDTPGRFTALCSYNGELAAFKPESITVIYGTNPSNYNTYVINGAGCIDGNSLCVTPYGVIYLSQTGFYCYSGSAPILISEKLRTDYISAAAAAAGDIYYAAAVRADGTRELLTCDLRRGIWHVQDDAEIDGLFAYRSGMYMISDSAVYEMTRCGADDSEWYFTTARTTAGSLDKKAVNELWIYADISEGAQFSAAVSVDDGIFTHRSVFTKSGLHVFRCPVRALMGTSFRIRLSGIGRVVIHDIEVRVAAGGRQYKTYS